MIDFALQTLIYAAPVLLAALGECLLERAGVLNIGLEGLLLAGALAAVLVSAGTGSAPLGVAAAAAAAMLLAALFALFGVVLRRDQVIVGTTINFLSLGLTGVLYRAWINGPGGSASVKTLPPLFLGLNGLTLFALALVPAAHWLLRRTRLGVTVRAAGEKPAAAAAAGTAVNRLRALLCLATGLLCGLGGASLSIGISNTFTEGMTAGRGFIALAVVVFGRWSPRGVLVAALLFAAADVGQARLQAMGSIQLPYTLLFALLKLPNPLVLAFPTIPYPIFLAIPYVFTLAALALRGAKVKPPAALGEPFQQG